MFYTKRDMGKLDDLEKKLYESKGEEQLSGRLLRKRDPLEGEGELSGTVAAAISNEVGVRGGAGR